MLREWGEKEKEELLLRNPILGQYAATEPHTPLSAVLTGFATPITPTSEKGTAPVGGCFPAAPPRGTTTTSCRNTRTLVRHVSLDEVVTVTNVKTIAPRSKRFLHCSHTVRSATTEERPLFKETIDAGAAAPLEVDDELSRGLCGRDDHFTENSAEERRQRRFNRVEKRALQLSNVLSQCHFFGAADVLQVLQGEPEKSGDADAPLTSCLEPKDLSRSVIGRVVALADRSLRRRAGDDDWDTFAIDDDDELAGDKTESFSLLGNTVDPYNSAADELCSVIDLGRMAAACAELDDYLKPSTATEVTT
ncbi:hypothetical protein DQ04_05031060 [Trypanosoma grayi]|uniref:hypothetical protein n=1 Tax=Trypanosoma grayi TaxID=71804 RepID=UPI0004F45B99|nr:hypothetical protein DQ04_05031060 [Trypanosoma grayi]KEG09559.1 hypothetical protein DQ04_05031060 [Trypanosoma grayi]